ncbi:MAG TPA: hypothetical protein VMA37_13485 [Acetobacteraceae bacterium]|nr:hypothetical protein [Acetobacteraceae bacterium]
MRRGILLLMAALMLAGCAYVTPPPSTARLPPGAFGGNDDNDIMAINLAVWAFSNPAHTRNNPVDAVRAVLAIEYLGGQLWSPRWSFMSQLTKLQMVQAREEVRATLGIAQDAPSQVVANALFALSLNPIPPVAAQVLRGPAFTLPPDVTLARIENLPYLPMVNVASQHAGQQEYPGNGPSCTVCG